MARNEQTCADSALERLPKVWDTQTVNPVEAFDFYRGGLCEAFMALRPEIPVERRTRFQAKVEHFELANGALNLVTASAHSVLKTRREIADSPEDCYYINYQLSGICHIEQGNETISLTPGDVAIFDSSRPFTMIHPQRKRIEVASFYVPHATMKEQFGFTNLDAPNLLTKPGVFGGLIREAASALSSGIYNLNEQDSRHLQSAFLSFCALAARAKEPHVLASDRREAYHFRLTSIIRRRCRMQGFSAKNCADEAGISVRYLHRLFAEKDESFSNYLLKSRLLWAAKQLRSVSASHLAVSAIALESGFADLSHFGRVFKKHYGATPGQYRLSRKSPN